MTSDSLSSQVQSICAQLELLAQRGVEIVDPRQVYVADDVDVSRIAKGVQLHPGVRLLGSKTFIGEGSVIGSQGPTTIRDCYLGKNVEIAAGIAEDAVLRDNVVVGPQAQIRPGTLLEEFANIAHCVGLKQTILLPYATLGSLINFCDCLLAGGTSRKDHSEVGSGFIHFNFTPWGERGDKATPSLFGDVVSGVFCDQPRVFLGGLSGAVGPRSVGFGAVTAAGQVLRRDVPAGTLSFEALRGFQRDFSTSDLDAIEPRREANIAYIAQLMALRRWYAEVRLAWSSAQSDETSHTLDLAGIELLDRALEQRHEQLTRFLRERDTTWQPAKFGSPTSEIVCPVAPVGEASFLAWVRNLGAQEKQNLAAWLQGAYRGDQIALQAHYA